SSKLSFESSTAFPLLLSSIESGRQNFNSKPAAAAPTFPSRPKNFTTSAHHNAATGNVIHNSASSHTSTHPSSNSLSQFSLVGAGKHRQHESSHQSNGGVKATPKPKSAATPNLITSSGS